VFYNPTNQKKTPTLFAMQQGNFMTRPADTYKRDASSSTATGDSGAAVTRDDESFFQRILNESMAVLILSLVAAYCYRAQISFTLLGLELAVVFIVVHGFTLKRTASERSVARRWPSLSAEFELARLALDRWEFGTMGAGWQSSIGVIVLQFLFAWLGSFLGQWYAEELLALGNASENDVRTLYENVIQFGRPWEPAILCLQVVLAWLDMSLYMAQHRNGRMDPQEPLWSLLMLRSGAVALSSWLLMPMARYQFLTLELVQAITASLPGGGTGHSAALDGDDGTAGGGTIGMRLLMYLVAKLVGSIFAISLYAMTTTALQRSCGRLEKERKK
jgi:hypothetical protein